MSSQDDVFVQETKSDIIKRLMREGIGRPHHISLAEALEFRRKEYGLTASEFAPILGLSKSHYSEVANHKRRLTIEATKRAYRIGIPVVILMQP